MEIEQLLMQSLQLLGLGMGAVFIILVLLIAIITIVSKIVPEEVTAPPGIVKSGIDSNHIAAISAAIHQYKKGR
ncbi:MAG: oxaloacetate decarboxylase subunit gamma [Gammaproteobacteria bacterium]|nr:oxaloacetate decarboxylase subunit gamma [Gammaproteobacteria bacterium]MCP4979349.1 oxaloacetate decarboxylase subunit gamma [Gammaproteobacteria bacterium]